MQDFNYLSSNDFELTFELSCNKYPKDNVLEGDWEMNKNAMLNYMWQVRVCMNYNYLGLCAKQINREIHYVTDAYRDKRNGNECCDWRRCTECHHSRS